LNFYEDMKFPVFGVLLMLIFFKPASPQISIQTLPLGQSQCSGHFIEHTLDHTTSSSSPVVQFYDSDGAGLAINDLNNDGLLDIVLANLKGRSTILWNAGHLNFRQETLADGQARAVNIVDVDGDGRQDIVLTHSLSAPTYWHNDGIGSDGRVHFKFGTLPGVRKPSYSMTWGDVNGDGLLDLITASYDSDLSLHLGNTFLFSDGAGIFYYQQENGEFVPTRFSKGSQALALLLTDFHRNGTPVLMVGNDFITPDQFWAFQNGQWTEIHPFQTITRNTMTFDTADINNDGRLELFAADMKPYSSDARTLNDWAAVFKSFAEHRLPSGDPQINENVLQIAAADGAFGNQARMMGVDATGWSWSAKFGDLNNDGFPDLYVVNGMIAAELFNTLPGKQLVEENQAFRNAAGNGFIPEPSWGLNSTASGRGMSLADLDSDGDLDIVVNNLNSPAQLFENQLCEGNSLEIDLRWPASGNTRALGAELNLLTSTGTYYRDIRAASGYLSGDPSRVHFGVPRNSQLVELRIRWPDGEITRLNTIDVNTLLTVTRS
jgi:hypothetical protein